MRLWLATSPRLYPSLSLSPIPVSVCGKMCSEACKLDIKPETFGGVVGGLEDWRPKRGRQHCLPLFRDADGEGRTSRIPPRSRRSLRQLSLCHNKRWHFIAVIAMLAGRVAGLLSDSRWFWAFGLVARCRRNQQQRQEEQHQQEPP